jgi:hypothetical protein
MRNTITLKRAAICADVNRDTGKECKAKLRKGSSARWYSNGNVYGLTCHEKPQAQAEAKPTRARVKPQAQAQAKQVTQAQTKPTFKKTVPTQKLVKSPLFHFTCLFCNDWGGVWDKENNLARDVRRHQRECTKAQDGILAEGIAKDYGKDAMVQIRKYNVIGCAS